MADENEQAQAAETDTATAADQNDTAGSQIGTTDNFSSYKDEVDAALRAEFIPDQTESEREQSADDDLDQEEEEESHEEQEEEDEEEEEQEAEKPKGSQRIRLKDPADQAVAAIAKAKGITLVAAAKIYEGQTEPRAEETQQQATQETAPLASVAVEAELKDLRAKYKEATRAIDVDAQADLFDEIEAKRDQLIELKASEARAKEAEDHQRSQAASQIRRQKEEDAGKKITAMYPGFHDENHPMYAESQNVFSEMEKNGDPLLSEPDLWWHIAKEAARRTGTIMAQPKKESQAPKKAKTGSPANLASGNRGTTATDPAKRTSDVIAGLKSTDDYEKLVAQLR